MKGLPNTLFESSGKQPYYADSETDWLNHRPDDQAQILHSVLLVGDAGAVATDAPDPIISLMRREMAMLPAPKQTIVFLGDNIYPRGMPPEGHRLRAAAEQIANTQISLLQHFKGNIFFLSGNHDWNKGKPNGGEYLLRQEQYYQERLRRLNIFKPHLNELGPEEIWLTDDILLLVINTQWWVQKEGTRPVSSAYSSRAENKNDFARLLKNILIKNRDKKILIVGHHPLYSNALHAGKFTPKQHVFPLTAIHKSLYFPLPIAGSLYPLYRKVFGAKEDMAHPRYRSLRETLLSVLKEERNNIVYVAGHEHNLQYFNRHNNHYVVSGSASKIAFVKKGGKAQFTHAHKGIAALRYYDNGQTWLEFLEPSAHDPNETVVIYRKLLS
ncbi:Calcineurin-like phosphoesterase [Flexibacter flexilis DSM 6793]|uniref:Calcineurin-like phosphoesterase n=1 Tax=Flexibacter flexilis DSM 6793 TaxID=927664 RepID=A0A1I1MG54_9BACT|nr:metallophosphoesterase [Flexibacter flexilis]SFC84116.1 Calcineurin-like phosphoesterase [Flexibacter flexilis DSM 6793]